MALRSLDICSGIGGIALALSRFGVRSVCHVEREAYAASVLAARMAEGRLDQAPIWADLATFDAAAWRGVADLITAGFPCQPFSAAGKRLGIQDERWLWPAIEQIIEDCEPAYVFLENVPGIVRHGLGYVLGGLARLGFDAEWDRFSAAETGAPHLRERFFLLARHADPLRQSACTVDDEVARLPSAPANSNGHEHESEPPTEQWEATAGISANPERAELRAQQGWPEPRRAREAQSRDDGTQGALADTDRPRLPDVQRCSQDAERSGLGTASGAGWWESEPDVGRVADGVPNRVGRLRALGNAVVPEQAALAWHTLRRRLTT